MFFNKKDTLQLGFLAANMWDRCGIVCPTGSTQLITPLGILANNTFEDTCHMAVKAYTDKNVFLYWSGGLDSTAVFLLLREYLHPSQITVLYTQASLDEYPGFYERHIAGVYRSEFFTPELMPSVTEKYCQEGTIVTGEISDQLFGSGWFLDADADVLKQGWKDFRGGIFLAIPNIEQSVAQCPRPIASVAEFLWWINYSLKYQYVQMRMLLDNKSSKLGENIFHFFDTTEFNNYAVSTPIADKIPNYDVKNCKYPLRNLIAKLSKDTDYAFNKPKVNSWGIRHKYPIATTIDTAWNRHYEGI